MYQILLSVLLFSLCGLASSAQPAAQTPPITVTPGTERIQDPAGAPFARLELTNTGTKEIAAWALRVRILNERQECIQTFHQTSMTSGILPSAKAAPIPPGRIWPEVLRLPRPFGPQGLSGHKAEVSVDYVLFTDSTDWGPNKTHSAEYFHGVRSGAEFERSNSKK